MPFYKHMSLKEKCLKPCLAAIWYSEVLTFFGSNKNRNIVLTRTVIIVEAKCLDLTSSQCLLSQDPIVVVEKFMVPTYFVTILIWSLLCTPNQPVDGNSPFIWPMRKHLLSSQYVSRLYQALEIQWLIHHSLTKPSGMHGTELGEHAC